MEILCTLVCGLCRTSSVDVTYPVLPLLLTFCIYSWEEISLSQTSLYIVKHISMWNSTILEALPVFYYGNPSFSIKKLCLYKIYISILSCVNVEGISLTFLHIKKQLHQLNTRIILRINTLQLCWHATLH